MQFKHPELLYALFLLLIPIIVHLFQLRRFKNVAFTNVAFLKNVVIQTRKSSQIKKWLTLLIRLLLLACIILAFAQPYFSKNKTLNKKTETVIYIDNSFSMQAKGPKGALLKRAIQDVINNIPENEELSIITNTNVYKNTTINGIKNELLQLEYAPKQLSYNAALLKSKTFFSKAPNSIKNLIFISDFQNKNESFSPDIDSLISVHAIKLEPVNHQNVSIDSAYISNTTPTQLELTVNLKNSGNPIENLPISLLNNEKLIAKTSITLDSEAKTSFTLPVNQAIDGEILVNDAHLQFDNALYFNINTAEKINVLAISDTDAQFLKRIYNDNEFNYTSTTPNKLNYNLINTQNLIVLNELAAIPSALITTLKSFTDNGGVLLVIPSDKLSVDNYNRLLLNYSLRLSKLIPLEKRITTINYNHPLYNNGVFEKRVKNFQYPKVNTYYNLKTNANTSILSFEDGKPFITAHNNTFLLTASLKKENSNFKNSPLIVPTFYNIAKQSFKIPQLYYSIGKTNHYDVKTTIQQDGVLSLENKESSFIPRQQTFNDKIAITTIDIPSKSGIYTIKDKTKALKNVSYNFRRDESNLSYQDISNLKGITVSDSITTTFDTLKSNTKINALWKWFVIFALILLLIEMLLLKYFK